MELTDQSFQHMSPEDKFNYVQHAYPRLGELLREVADLIKNTNRCCDSLSKDYGNTILVRNMVYTLDHSDLPVRVPNSTKLYQFQSDLKVIPLNIQH